MTNKTSIHPSIQLYGSLSTPRKISALPLTKSIQLHLKSQTVTYVAMFHDNIATIVIISQLSQLCIENLWESWKKPGYHHTHSQLSQFFYENCDCFEIPWHSFFQDINFFMSNKNPNAQWSLLYEKLIGCLSQHWQVTRCRTLKLNEYSWVLPVFKRTLQYSRLP